MNQTVDWTSQLPVIAVRPGGNQLFIGWNDRRGDPDNNSMIDVYGRFGTIAANGDVQLAGYDFRITTESFPPAFPGTLSANLANGHYDPVWPPGFSSASDWVNLNWCYPSWFPPPPEDEEDWLPGPPVPDGAQVNATRDTYAHEHGEHNGVCADQQRVYMVWSDNRSASQGTAYPGRKQTDVRLVRITWSQP